MSIQEGGVASGQEEEAGQETASADLDLQVGKLVRSLHLDRGDDDEGATHTRPAGEDGDEDNSPLLFGFGPSSAPTGVREGKEKRPLSSATADAIAAAPHTHVPSHRTATSAATPP